MLLFPQVDIEPVEGMKPLMEEFLERAPDGIESLEPHWPILEALLKQPVADHITYHSVIGNHNNQEPLKESTDTVVPYWSSHLDGAASEKIVQAKHTTITPNAEAIEELRRILYLHLGAPYTPTAVAPMEDQAPATRRTTAGRPHLRVRLRH